MISIALCFLAVLFAILRKRHCGVLVSVGVVALLCGVEILGYSACGYYLACFGVPSVLSVALSVLYCLKVVLHQCASITHRSRIYHSLAGVSILPFCVQILWVVFGVLLYLGFLGIGLIDIYHIDSRIQAICIAVFIVVAGVCSRIFGILACAALGYQAWNGLELYSGVLDVGLWAWCVMGGLWGIWQRVRCV